MCLCIAALILKRLWFVHSRLKRLWFVFIGITKKELLIRNEGECFESNVCVLFFVEFHGPVTGDNDTTQREFEFEFVFVDGIDDTGNFWDV